jgi:hypothetical protein
MPIEAPAPASTRDPHDSPSQETSSATIRYWELRRVWYNLALALLVVWWIVRTWPHFAPVMTLESLGKLLVLALIANVCYSTAYVVDFAVQASAMGPGWRRWRWLLWLAGTLFALFFATYWIGDEIYPDVPPGQSARPARTSRLIPSVSSAAPAAKTSPTLSD